MDNLNLILSSFEQYIDTHVCIKNMHSYSISIAFNSYDLIDSDLDYNEAYYNGMINNMENIIINELKNVVKYNNLHFISLNTGIKLMSSYTTALNDFSIYPNMITKYTQYKI